MRLLVDGRGEKRGFAAFGFDCVYFNQGGGHLRNRIEQFAEFITGLQKREPGTPLVTFGYSAGGLVSRGFLRAYPARSQEIRATLLVGVPNRGLVTDDVGGLLRLLRFSGEVIEDIDIESDFIRWINGVGGHWEQGADGKKRWRLDAAPWVAPEDAKVLHLVGRPPRYAGVGDGIVDVDSATLEGRMRHEYVDAPSANHLNLCGLWNALTLITRRWRGDDKVWPAVVRRAAEFYSSADGRP